MSLASFHVNTAKNEEKHKLTHGNNRKNEPNYPNSVINMDTSSTQHSHPTMTSGLFAADGETPEVVPVPAPGAPKAVGNGM